MCHVFCVCLCVCMCVCVLFSEFLFGFFFLLSPYLLSAGYGIKQFFISGFSKPSFRLAGMLGQGCPQVRSYIGSAEGSHATQPFYSQSLLLMHTLFSFHFCCQALPDNNAAAILKWPRFAAFILQDWADLWPHIPVASTLGPRPQTFLQIFLVRRWRFLEVVVPPITSANVI